jgi:hypothetical protein
MLCAYYYSPKHVIEDYPELLKKWEDKKSSCNMVHVEPCKNKKKNEEVDVWVVTQGGVNTGAEFEHGEGLGQNSKGNIRKEAYPPLNFDVAQQK